MSYLSSPTSTSQYGVVRVGDYIEVTDGVISLLQDVAPTATVSFDEINVATDLNVGSDINALGTVSGTSLLDNGERVITSVTPTAGTAISITGLVSGGPDSSFTINNTGVTSLTAGTGISLSGTTGDITISSFGADLINVVGVTSNYAATLTDEYIGVSSTSSVTVTLPMGADGRVYIIKDEYGQGSGKITIQPPLGVKIDGAINYIISVPHQSVQIVYRGGNWWIM